MKHFQVPQKLVERIRLEKINKQKRKKKKIKIERKEKLVYRNNKVLVPGNGAKNLMCR